VRQKEDDANKKYVSYKKLFAEAAKVGPKYRLNGRLEQLYIVNQEGNGWSLRRG
jgi:hypothetical protein